MQSRVCRVLDNSQSPKVHDLEHDELPSLVHVRSVFDSHFNNSISSPVGDLGSSMSVEEPGCWCHSLPLFPI